MPVGFILKLMPFRSTLFLKVLGSFLAAAYFRRAFRASGRLQRGAAAAIVIATACVLLAFQSPALPYWLSGRYVLALAVIILTAALAWLTGRSQLPVWSWRWAPTVSSHIRSIRLGLAALASAMLVAVSVTAQPHARFIIPSSEPANDLEQAAAWAKASTPADALFLTPPDAGFAEFTVFAERNTLADAKLAGQALFDPNFGMIVFQRLVDLGCSGRWCVGDNAYSSFDAQAFRALGERYGACFALTRASQQVELSEAYGNLSYRIYALC
jgi:hypothetical protein